jgi:hypothetical protein
MNSNKRAPRLSPGPACQPVSPVVRLGFSSMLALGVMLLGGACSSGTDADALGIGAICQEDADCAEVTIAGEQIHLKCLKDFKDGYCGLPDCASDAECPEGATCVAHTDGNNYCFRECSAKSECNENRPPESEANCSSSFDYADAADESENKKACLPPSA